MIDINEVIDGLEYVNGFIDKKAYYNPKTKEIFYSNIWEYENNEEEFDDLIENSIVLPSKYEINEYSMMEDFIETIEDTLLYNQLLIAINGSGAFRRFKDTCINFGIIDNWYKFRDKKYKELAINWCKENNIDFKE